MHKIKFCLLTIIFCSLSVCISCEVVSYNPLKIKQDPSLFQAGITPEKSFNILLTSFRKNNPQLFYYMLSARVRNDFPYWRIANSWENIQKNLGVDLINARILKSEYIDVSPFVPTQAARIVLEYQHPQQDTVVESFLFLFEIVPEFGEKRPSWRLHFPFNNYQDNAIWFTLLTGNIVKE